MKEIPAQILKKVKTVLVEHMDDVLMNALDVKTREEIFKALPEEKEVVARSSGAGSSGSGRPSRGTDRSNALTCELRTGK